MAVKKTKGPRPSHAAIPRLDRGIQRKLHEPALYALDSAIRPRGGKA